MLCASLNTKSPSCFDKEGKGGGGGKGEGQTFVWEGARGRHRNDFFPSHLLCTFKVQIGGGGHGVNGGTCPPPIVTPLIKGNA